MVPRYVKPQEDRASDRGGYTRRLKGQQRPSDEGRHWPLLLKEETSKEERMAEESKTTPVLTFEDAVPGEALGNYQYTLTAEQFERFRESVEYSNAPFPTIARDGIPHAARLEDV